MKTYIWSLYLVRKDGNEGGENFGKNFRRSQRPFETFLKFILFYMHGALFEELTKITSQSTFVIQSRIL